MFEKIIINMFRKLKISLHLKKLSLKKILIIENGKHIKYNDPIN
jgi:hypothetical protein